MMKVWRRLNWLGRLALGGIVLWFLAPLYVPRPPLLDGVSLSVQVLDREGRLLRLGLTADDC